jgi:hypothetical protein
MIKTFKFAVTALALSATAAVAGNAPWESRAPSGMSAQHQQFAAQAQKVHASVGQAGFGYNPLQATWNYKGDRLPKTPLSNISVNELNSALTGRYFVYRAYTGKRNDNWSVMYFAKDGKTHICKPSGSSKRYKQEVFDRYVVNASFGLGGFMHWDHKGYRSKTPPKNERVGWPLVANANTGEVVMYGWHRGKWHPEAGWLQNDYAAAFAQYCPDLPRAGSVNNAQTGRKMSEIAQGARAYRGFKTAFQNDPRNPLTAGMYYHLYPPVR